MILDHELEFSNAQAVTASAASTNIVDLGADRMVGISSGCFLVVNVVAAATAAGAATVDFQLQQSDDSAFGTFDVLFDAGAIAKASLVAGYEIDLQLPLNTSKRYLRLYYTVATGPLTAGAFSAHIVDGYQANLTYPAGNY